MPDTASDQDVQVWRAPGYLRTVSGMVFAGQVIASVWFGAWLIGEGDLLLAFVLPLACAVVDTRIWFQVLRPRTLAGPEGVTIRSGVRTTHVAWTDIDRCQAGYSGIVIGCLSGARALAPWPQKANIARWTGRTTTADHVAAYLELRAKYFREGIKLDDDQPEASE